MEPVWMPPMTCVFKPDHAVVKRLLPDVAEVEWKFFDIDGENRFDPHLVSEAKFSFSNGRVLVVPGHLLWKFRATVLPGLESGRAYRQDNPFSRDTAENLAMRLRAAHDACCVKGNPILERRPISITHDLRTGVIVPCFRSFLSKESVSFLLAVTGEVGDAAQYDALADVKILVELETSRPMFDLGFKDLGNGMMGRTPIETPWPDLNTISFDQFLELLSQDKREDCPAHTTMLRKFSAIVDRMANTQCVNVVTKAREANPVYYSKAGRELGCKANLPSVASFCRALATSDDRNLVADGLWSLWHGRLKGMSLREILAIRPPDNSVQESSKAKAVPLPSSPPSRPKRSRR